MGARRGWTGGAHVRDEWPLLLLRWHLSGAQRHLLLHARQTEQREEATQREVLARNLEESQLPLACATRLEVARAFCTCSSGAQQLGDDHSGFSGAAALQPYAHHILHIVCGGNSCSHV